MLLTSLVSSFLAGRILFHVLRAKAFRELGDEPNAVSDERRAKELRK
jgi:hypothetical protein